MQASPPTPFYTLITTSLGGKPAIVVVNSALRWFSGRPKYPWHLRITISCKFLGDNEMPTTVELESLRVIEDRMTNKLCLGDNVIFLARVTALGEQAIIFRVSDPEIANKTLQELTSDEPQIREWEYWMERDQHWELAQPELDLVARAK